MKIPIPDDWNGDDWLCVRIHWPDSPTWLSILQGLTHLVAMGRFWDERTGTITAVQAIGREIYERTYPLVDCCGDLPDVPGGSNGPDYDSVCAIISCVEDYLMTNCSIPYGSIKYIGGVLHYRYCGEWYPVEGATEVNDWEDPVAEPPVTQPDELDPPWEQPEEFNEATACSKATVLMDVVFGVVDDLLDSAQVPELPNDAITSVFDRYPMIDFGDTNLLLGYTHAIQIRTLGGASETEDEDFQAQMLCMVSNAISDGPQGLDKDERAAVQTSIDSVCRRNFTLLTHPTYYESVRQLYVAAYRSIGAKDTVNLTSYAYATGDEDCTCPGDLTYVFDGGVRFTGEAHESSIWTPEEWTLETLDGGRILKATWTISDRYHRSAEPQFMLDYGADGVPPTQFVIRVYPQSGYMPPVNLVSEDPGATLPATGYWANLSLNSPFTEVNTDLVTALDQEFTANGGLDDAAHYWPRAWPWSSHAAVTYVMYFEIVEIEGVSVIP